MEKILQIIEETFRVNKDSITMETKMEDIDSWDSLTHMELIVSLEDEFELEFTAEEIMEMTTVKKIVELVEAKRNGNKE